MIVAHPPGAAPPVLHTGDARLTKEATQNNHLLQAMRGKAVLVLDTTYCNPEYSFPSQQEVLHFTMRAVQVCEEVLGGAGAAITTDVGV